jgi:hypothetical protein
MLERGLAHFGVLGEWGTYHHTRDPIPNPIHAHSLSFFTTVDQ